jgi:hypothetical protein
MDTGGLQVVANGIRNLLILTGMANKDFDSMRTQRRLVVDSGGNGEMER